MKLLPIRAGTLALLWLSAETVGAAPVPEPPPPASASAADTTAVDPDWILAGLARPAPARTDFVEVRGSALLKTPLRLSGEYQRPDANTLVREVRAPYAETTTIVVGDRPGAGEVTIARAGKPPRRFSLARMPELGALQSSFGALLAGDRPALERYYRLAASGARRQWSLTLTPKDASVAQRLKNITLFGRGNELMCIETRPARGSEQQRTLLEGAARAAADIAEPSQLAALCRGHGAAHE